eukprot:s126_g26.t1
MKTEQEYGVGRENWKSGGQSVFHVICAHFFCFDCASQQYMKQQQAQANEYFCPTCRATAHEVMPMPDIAVNPRLWFQFLDVNRSGQIDQNMTVQALEAMLPIDTERLHEFIAGGWAAWAKGHVTENDFFSKGGLLEWIRAHQHDLANTAKRGAAPSLPADDLQDWFRHWDVEHRGTLDKGQVLRALCEASKTSSLETRRIQELKEGITKVWDKYALSRSSGREGGWNGMTMALEPNGNLFVKLHFQDSQPVQLRGQSGHFPGCQDFLGGRVPKKLQNGMRFTLHHTAAAGWRAAW